MAQSQIQEQKQEQRLQQSISQQQLLQSHLIELPIQQFAERIETEMHDNPALESAADNQDFPEFQEYPDSAEPVDDFDTQREREERSDALDAALENIGRDDEDLPVPNTGAMFVVEDFAKADYQFVMIPLSIFVTVVVIFFVKSHYPVFAEFEFIMQCHK